MVKPVIPSITHSTGVVLYENIYQTSQVTIKEGTEIEFHYQFYYFSSFFLLFFPFFWRGGWKLGLAEILFEFPNWVLIIWDKLFSFRVVACCLIHLNLLYFNRLPRQPWPSKWVWGQAQILADPLSSGVLPWSKDCSPWPEGWKSFAWQQHEYQNSRYSEYRWYSVTPYFYEGRSSNSIVAA